MRTVLILCFATVALTSGMVWASAAGWLDPTSGIFTEHENVPKYQDPQPIQPYAELNFSDEAAQTLGVHERPFGKPSTTDRHTMAGHPT